MQAILKPMKQPKERSGIFGRRGIVERNTEINIAPCVLITPGIRTKEIKPTHVVMSTDRFDPFFYFLQVHGRKLGRKPCRWQF